MNELQIKKAVLRARLELDKGVNKVSVPLICETDEIENIRQKLNESIFSMNLEEMSFIIATTRYKNTHYIEFSNNEISYNEKSQKNSLKKGWIDLPTFRQKYCISKDKAFRNCNKLESKDIDRFPKMIILNEQAFCDAIGIKRMD